MTSETIRYVNLPSSISLTSIVSASAVIFSDPDPNGKREALRFDQVAVNPMSSRWDGRGGILQVELSAGIARVKLEVAPTEAASSGVSPANRFLFPSFNGTVCGASTPKNNLPRQMKQFTSTNAAVSPRRGYLKVSYLGNTPAYPFAIRSKVMTLDDWNMNFDTYPQEMWSEGSGWLAGPDAYGKTFPFLSTFGFTANRIAALEATIQSDFLDGTTRTYSDFRRLRWGSGGSGPDGDLVDVGGGAYFVDEAKDKLFFNLACRTPGGNGCSWTFFQSLHDLTGNRGYVNMDYVAGSCDAGGPSGYSIRAIPGNRTGSCTGTSQPFSIEGAGMGIGNGSTVDEFAFVYQNLSNAANRTVTVKINSHNSSDFGSMAGVMIRGALASNSIHASLLAKPNLNQRFAFRRRTTTGTGNAITQASGAITVQPCWVRIRKAGNVFSGFYHTSTGDVMPTTGWVSLGSVTINNFPGTYYLGLATSNHTSPDLGKVTYRSLTVTNP